MSTFEDIKEGYNFKCISCGRCCRGVNEGVVFLYKNEIEKICKFLKIEPQEFFEKYAEIIDADFRIFSRNHKPTKRKIYLQTIVLKQDPKDGACIFLNNATNLCLIYEVRPLQCRSWPSWYNIMTKKEDYEEAKEKCPGLRNGTDEFVTKERILKCIKEEIRLEQKYIKCWKKNRMNIKKVYPFLKKIRSNID